MSERRLIGLRPVIAAFLIGLVIGTAVAGAVWTVNSRIAVGDTAQSEMLHRWTQGVGTTLFPAGILMLNPDASPATFGILLALNGLAFGFVSMLAWKIAKSRGQTTVLTGLLVLFALILNNAWLLVAMGTAARNGPSAVLDTVTLIHWPSFFAIAICIIGAEFALYRCRSGDL